MNVAVNQGKILEDLSNEALLARVRQLEAALEEKNRKWKFTQSEKNEDYWTFSATGMGEGVYPRISAHKKLWQMIADNTTEIVKYL
jgi:hypothetical protein